MVDYYLGYRKRKFVLAAAILFGLLAAAITWHRVKEEAGLQESLSREVIRFHVLANSDSESDQELKLEVRDELLDYMEALLKDSDTREDSRSLLEEHMRDIQEIAGAYVKEQGYGYPVTAELVTDDFPEKTYGDCVFPAGEYEALRVSIGAAEGHNWWCMVYPGLCFTEEGGAFVSEDNKELLKHVLTEEEFEMVTEKHEVKLTFKFLKFFR